MLSDVNNKRIEENSNDIRDNKQKKSRDEAETATLTRNARNEENTTDGDGIAANQDNAGADVGIQCRRNGRSGRICMPCRTMDIERDAMAARRKRR